MVDFKTWTPSFQGASHVNGPAEMESLSLPSENEAKCYIMATRDGLWQSQIAEKLGTTQGTVSRRIRTARAKIDALKRSGRFDADEIDRLLGKLVSESRELAPVG